MGLLAIPCGAHAKDAAEKPRSPRKMYDFTRPRAGEMLANPTMGAGSPPRLEEFAPGSALHLAQDETDTPLGSGEAARAGHIGSRSRPAFAGPAVQLSEAQIKIGEQIAKSGIDGFIARPPPTASIQEQQYWESVRKQISTSLATWQALYAAPETVRADAPAVVSGPKR